MNEIVIHIDWIYFFGLIGALIGVAWYSSGRFSTLETSMEWVKESIKNLQTTIQGANNNLFKSHSPVALTDKGDEVLEKSGLKQYIDERQESLIKSCCDTQNVQTPYDVQQSVFHFFSNYVFEEEYARKFKEYAFSIGVEMEVVRRVGAIYFRDILLEHLGMKIEDVDHVIS